MILTYTNKKLLTFIIILLGVLCESVNLFAQAVPVYEQRKLTIDSVPKMPRPDTLHHRTKHFGRASLQFELAEVTPWAFDKFLKKADYANISFKTVGNNLKPGSWTWDDDNFQTNQFGHPYHGSQFFNAFRTNGYSFWQSVPAAMAGSYIWESTAENQPPAINDFINTSFGGIVLGEMTYRLSNKIINNQATGFKRQVSEVFGLLVDPQNGLTRLLDGKWGKVSRNSKERDSSKITAEFGIGARSIIGSSGPSKNKNFGLYGHVKLLYGNAYENYTTPFSNISINAEFGKDDSSKVNIISVYGSVAGWEIESTEKLQHLAVLSANYDFIHNQAFFYGGQSVKINLLSEYDLTKKTRINTNIGAGPILLAAIPDPYLQLPHGRNYDYGPGFAFNAGGQLTIDNIFTYNINYRGGWTETVNGHPSHYFLHTVSSEVGVKILNGFSLSAESGYFELRGYYKNYANVIKNYPYVRMAARYMVNL